MELSHPIIKNLTKRWQQAGIDSGDTVLIHSSLRRTLMEAHYPGCSLSPNDILVSFIEAVGNEGTLLFPLFNFSFTNTGRFDARHTPSQMGALTEAARVYRDSIRTGHPIYSFAVLGHHKNLFKDIDNYSGYGSSSPFGILHSMNGKIAVLDLEEQNSMTFYHYIEECHGVKYRFHKEFSGDYTDIAGITTKRSYGLFVRDLDNGVETHVNPMGELLWKKGLYSGDRPGIASGLRVVSSLAMFEEVSSVITNNKAEGILYEIRH